jgi:mycofactocin precursor
MAHGDVSLSGIATHRVEYRSSREGTAMADAVETVQDDDEIVVEELLVEEVSIDGMCGVY